ncbi:MAG: R3H domain-containing nucleic acid-binding protein [Patescibacteria group bacterium]
MKQKEIIKEIIEIMLKKLCVNFDEIQFVENNEFNNGVKFIIKTNDSGILIGNAGVTIYALNHLVKKIIWKKTENFDKKINFFIDVNNYQGDSIEKIKQQALDIAKKVDLFKRDIEMPIVNSYERMIIHSVLIDDPKVCTESIGEGDLRRVVVKTKQN